MLTKVTVNQSSRQKQVTITEIPAGTVFRYGAGADYYLRTNKGGVRLAGFSPWHQFEDKDFPGAAWIVVNGCDITITE